MSREKRAANWVGSDVSKNQGPVSAIHLDVYNIVSRLNHEAVSLVFSCC